MPLVGVPDGCNGVDFDADRVVTAMPGVVTESRCVGQRVRAGGDALAALAGTFDHFPEVGRG